MPDGLVIGVQSNNPCCERRIFTERLPTIAVPHAQRTPRLATILLVFGVAVGGLPGTRLLGAIGIGVSGDTLRRVLGVDDWSLRKGRTYGTILVDLEAHRPVDLLLDRSAASLETWLREHPGAEIICRDRGGAYADGARQGAPDAIQVADRWHLPANLGDTLERVIVEQQVPMPQAPLPPPPPPAAAPDASVSAHERERLARQTRREERYGEVQRLRAQGRGYRAITHQLGLHRATVRKYAAAPGLHP